MLTPRRVRPDTITVHTDLGEVNLVKTSRATQINYVAVKRETAKIDSKTGETKDDTLLVVFDMSDLVASQNSTKATYVKPEAFEETALTFTIRDSVDIIEYDGVQYQIEKVVYHTVVGNRYDPAIIEVYLR